MIRAVVGSAKENELIEQSAELGRLRIAFQPRASKKTICLWNSTDDDSVEFDCEISCDSILVVIQVRGEYLKVFTENFKIGWIHITNTESL